MKTFMFTCILLLVLGAAGLLYLHLETERFVENLPKPPNADVQPDTVDVQRFGENGEHLAEETPPAETSVSGEAPPVVTETQTAAETEPGAVSDSPALAMVPVEELPQADVTTNPPDDMHAVLDGQKTEASTPLPGHFSHCQPGVKRYWNGMPIEERQARLREDLLKEFGDIPEVHLYLRHTGNPNPEALTLDETVQYFRAVATLYPHQREFMEQQISMLREMTASDSYWQSH